MDRLPVFQRHHAKNTSAKVRNDPPMPDSAVWLNLCFQGVCDDLFAPLPTNVGAFAQNLLFEIARRLQRDSDYRRTRRKSQIENRLSTVDC